MCSICQAIEHLKKDDQKKALIYLTIAKEERNEMKESIKGLNQLVDELKNDLHKLRERTINSNFETNERNEEIENLKRKLSNEEKEEANRIERITKEVLIRMLRVRNITLRTDVILSEAKSKRKEVEDV